MTISHGISHSTVFMVLGVLPPTIALVAIVWTAILRAENVGARNVELMLLEAFNCTQVGLHNDTKVWVSDEGEAATISRLYFLSVALTLWACVPYIQATNHEQRMLRYQEVQRMQEVDTEFSSASMDQSPGARATSAWSHTRAVAQVPGGVQGVSTI